MAWKWLWNTETKYYDGEITRDTDWGGDASTDNQPVSGGRVQEWLKNEINGKFGVIRISSTVNENNFYSLEMFATKEDEKAYDEDPTSNEGLVTRVAIPISTVQGDAYTATLRTSIGSDSNIVVSGNELLVPLNYRSIKISQYGNENAAYQGTLVVERSTDGSTWTRAGQIPNVLTPREIDDTENYGDKVNIAPYLAQGRQAVRLRATYVYVNEEGEEKTVTSSNVLVGASVTKTTLELRLVTNFEQPMSAYDVNGNTTPFSVTYGVYGSVQKTLYMKVDNGNASAYPLDASVDSVNRTVSVNGASYLTHGVHKVEAWLECQDGLGNTLKSDVLVNRFMMVNDKTSGADLTKPYLLLQNVDGEIDNFVQTEIAQYAVYNPSGENMNVAFLLTAYSENYETTKPEEYFRLETIVEPRKAYSLLTTIEIENENEGTEILKYDTYFRVRRITDTTDTDFMYESTGERNYYVMVDNANAMTPVSGATFLLNPKVRNNNEDNPLRILNAKNNNAEVASTWTKADLINGTWVTADDGQKVLRIMAGTTLEIKKNVWAQFLSNPNSSMTFEIDFKVSNVTNTTDPIVRMFEGTPSSFRGLCMNALEGWLMPASESSKDDTMFAWREGVRTHVAVNLHHQVKPNKGDVYYTEANANKADGIIPLARVVMNGEPVREMKFNTAANANEWCSSANGSIIIGNEGADIDIYSIRIYENKVVEMTDILNRNYIATLPKAEDKTRVKEKNDLLDGGRISLEKTKNKGLNCYVWHGKLPYHGNQAEQTGWVEIWRYDQDGNYLPEYSGTICEKTKSLVGKGQGSTAKTYYDWNLQEDSSKVKAMIQVSVSKFHSEIRVGSPYTGGDGKQYVDIYGGHLGKNAPVEIPENAQAYEYSNGMVTVPDGWFDGNGMYRGMGYRVAPDTSLAQKRVIKINYASSMQSHLIGACNTYDLLHRKVVGDTPLQEVIPDAVSAKRTEPFMFFNQEEGQDVYFKGMGNYGAGKADKVTWGFVKKQMPMYALIEGSDNNLPMTEFRVPFDKNTAVYSTKGEGWLYNGQQSWDFDLGNTTDKSDMGYATDGTMNDDGEVEMPTDAITQRWADIHNFIYLHSTNLKYFNGTFEEFKQSSAASDTNYKYWCTSGEQAFCLKRYDYINSKWIDAGLLRGNTYRVLNLKTYYPSEYNKWVSDGTGDYAILNQIFIDAGISIMRKFLKFFINEKSLQFNYCYVLGFLAGTDNSAKNTYYKIDPIGVPMETDTTFSNWYSNVFDKDFDFTSVHQCYFDGDDMDSILRTNNNAHQTKPYYIDRLHPYADGSTTSLYEGMGNQLFNYVERAYESTGELSAMMNRIMIAATELVNEDDKLLGLGSGEKSLWGFLHKYFFNIQHYFPQIAYMEQARIRYEFPELLGFISSGGGARSIRPITQSLGSQLQNELQYMNQRVIYMTSYAAFGAWGGDTIHSIGLSDADATFSFTPAAMPDGSASTYTFTITPHQYIYPSHYYGGTFTSTRQRTSPSQTCTFTIASGIQGSDTGLGICGINYISLLGDFANKSITGDLNIRGKRLKQITASYIANNAFRPSSVRVESYSVSIILLDVSNVLRQLGAIDLSKNVRVKNIQIFGRFTEVLFPESSSLEIVGFGSYGGVLKLANTPNLTMVSIAVYYSSLLKQFHIGENVGTNVEGFTVQPIVEQIYSAQKAQANPNLQSIHVENVNWTDFDVEALSWFADRPTCEFKGRIAIKEDGVGGVPRVTWDLKNKFLDKFGNVDQPSHPDHKGLVMSYQRRVFIPEKAILRGNFYVESSMNVQFKLVPSSPYENTQTAMNFYSNGDSSVYMNAGTGVLSVYSLKDSQYFVRVWANVNYINDQSVSTFVSVVGVKNIEIWNRPAQLGDLVYADGTFSSAASYDGEKTPIGLCFWIGKDDGTGKYMNPNDTQKRLMVALENTQLSLATGETASLQWGAFPINTSETDEFNAQYALYDTDDSGTRVNLTSASEKLTSVYDISTIVNLTTRGLDNAYIDPDPTTNPSGESDYRDLNTPTAVEYNDGFKLCEPNTAIGDGFAYNETTTQVRARTLDDGLASLAGSGYKSGSIVNSAYAKTLKVIAHRNALLSSNLLGADNAVLLTGGTFELPKASASTSEMESLASLIDNLRAWASGTLVDAYPNKWSQLAYPFVSACYAYEPEREWKEGEVLADKFKAHNWFAPTEGLLARICWFVQYGETGGMDVFKDARDKGFVKFSISTSSSGHWSVTESGSSGSWGVNFSNGYSYDNGKRYSSVGRAVSAF